MKKFIDFIKSDQLLFYSVMVFIVLQPILELDLYLQDFYAKTGILALSTSIRILGIAYLAFLVWFRGKSKIRDLLLWGGYGIVLGVYVVLHFLMARTVDLNLPNSYAWVGSYELKYILFMVIPFVLIWVTSRVKITKNHFNTVVLFVSMFVCLNILITNVMVSSYGAYGGITYQNLFTWFGNVYEEYKPKELTSIGFFFYANPISGFLIVLFPLLIKAFLEEKNRLLFGIGVVLHMITMFLLGTRVGAYGTIICLGATLLAYLFFVVIRYIDHLDKAFVLFTAILTLVSALILPVSPAYKNAIFGYEDEWGFADNERNLADSLANLDLDPDDVNYKYALIYQIENIWIYYMTFPREYYTYYYSYKFDPEFYLDLLKLPFEKRNGGRVFQQYFMQRKFDELAEPQKLFGLGYSRMSQGGIVLEQDFMRQYYVLGSVGMLLTAAPYLVLFAVFGLTLLLKIKNRRIFNFENAILFMSYSLGLIIAYYSGHILDEPIGAFFIAFAAGKLLWNMRCSHEEA